LAHGVEYGSVDAAQSYQPPDGMIWYTARQADCWGLSRWPPGFNRGRRDGEYSACPAAFHVMYERRWRRLMREDILVPRGSTEPSFNCSRARSSMELLICADEDLANVDAVLGRVWRSMLALCEPVECNRHRADQRRWLVSRDERCETHAANSFIQAKACILTHTNARIERLWAENFPGAS
jgi:uncharacterized protein YecT (DUF1311 family)